MSYILEALRRAESERERKRGGVPGLHARPIPMPSPDELGERRGNPWAWIAGALTVGVWGAGVGACASGAGVAEGSTPASGDGSPDTAASHDRAAARRVDTTASGKRRAHSANPASRVKSSSEVQESERGSELSSIRRSRIFLDERYGPKRKVSND